MCVCVCVRTYYKLLIRSKQPDSGCLKMNSGTVNYWCEPHPLQVTGLVNFQTIPAPSKLHTINNKTSGFFHQFILLQFYYRRLAKGPEPGNIKGIIGGSTVSGPLFFKLLQINLAKGVTQIASLKNKSESYFSICVCYMDLCHTP